MALSEVEGSHLVACPPPTPFRKLYNLRRRRARNTQKTTVFVSLLLLLRLYSFRKGWGWGPIAVNLRTWPYFNERYQNEDLS